MNNRETRHMIARKYCVHMNAKGMFANENVTDDNGGLIKHGFVFENIGGLFAPSLTVLRTNTPLMAKHFTNCTTPILKTLLKTFMLSLLWPMYNAKLPQLKFKTDTIPTKTSRRNNRKRNLKMFWKFRRNQHTMVKRRRCTIMPTTLGKKTNYAKAHSIHTKPTGNICWSYWKNKKVFAQLLKSRCPPSSSGPWKISCDAINPLLGHIPGNLRLVCLYNNVTDLSKLNKDLTDTTPTSLTTEIHDEYWRIVR